MKRLFATMALVTLATPTWADQVVRVSDLAAHCQNADTYCLGYLDGYADAGSLYQMTAMVQHASLPNDLAAFCLPSSFRVEVAARQFASVFAHHPDIGNDAAGTGLLMFFSANYPCSKTP